MKRTVLHPQNYNWMVSSKESLRACLPHRPHFSLPCTVHTTLSLTHHSTESATGSLQDIWPRTMFGNSDLNVSDVQFSSHFQNAIIYLLYILLSFFLYAFLRHFLLLLDGGPSCGMLDDRLFEMEAALIQVPHCLVLTLHIIVFHAIIHRLHFLDFFSQCLFNVKGLTMPYLPCPTSLLLTQCVIHGLLLSLSL